jgi:hypothetical protein
MYSSQQASCCLQWCFCFLHKHRVLCCLHSPRSTLPDDRASGPDADVARDLPAGRGRMRGGVSERKERRGKAVRGRQRVGSTCQLWTVEGAGTSTLGAAWRSLRKWMDPSYSEQVAVQTVCGCQKSIKSPFRFRTMLLISENLPVFILVFRYRGHENASGDNDQYISCIISSCLAVWASSTTLSYWLKGPCFTWDFIILELISYENTAEQHFAQFIWSLSLSQRATFLSQLYIEAFFLA